MVWPQQKLAPKPGGLLVKAAETDREGLIF